MNIHTPEKILAVYPNKNGFSWLIFDTHYGVIDYGRKEVKSQEDATAQFQRLLDEYYINRVITERFNQHSQRKAKAQAKTKAFKTSTRKKRIKIASFSIEQVNEVFVTEGATTKYSRAQVTASILPSLKIILPEKRKIWNAENQRMHLFDCAALILTYLCHRENCSLTELKW